MYKYKIVISYPTQPEHSNLICLWACHELVIEVEKEIKYPIGANTFTLTDYYNQLQDLIVKAYHNDLINTNVTLDKVYLEKYELIQDA